MQKKYLIFVLLLLFLLTAGLFIVAVNNGGEEKEPMTLVEEKKSDEGEDLSNYFNVDKNEETFKPESTPSSVTTTKCRINNIEVDQGTVVDDSTCVVN